MRDRAWRLRGAPDHRDGRAQIGQRGDDGGADAAARAGHDRVPAGQRWARLGRWLRVAGRNVRQSSPRDAGRRDNSAANYFKLKTIADARQGGSRRRGQSDQREVLSDVGGAVSRAMQPGG